MLISPLLQAQFEFTEDLALLIRFCQDQDWKVKITEMGILQPRKTVNGDTVVDAVHKTNGNHYRGLAADLEIFIPNENEPGSLDHITSSDHHCWQLIAAL